MLNDLKSRLLFLAIQVDRIVDHFFRYLTGLPLAKRSLITPDIYLGGQYGVYSIKTLKKLGVTAVVNMRTWSVHKDIKNLGVKILHLPTKDKQAPTISQLKKGVKFITSEIKKGGKVYIHCRFGEERGPTMAIAYLIYTGMNFEDAYKLVRKTRTFINPTQVQRDRLKEFEQILI